MRASRDWVSVALNDFACSIPRVFRSNWIPVIPTLGSGDFEVHIAKVVFAAEDVGQQNPVIIRFFDHPNRDPRNGVLDADAGGH